MRYHRKRTYPLIINKNRKQFSHLCPDKTKHFWKSYYNKPIRCPRCQCLLRNRTNYKNKHIQELQLKNTLYKFDWNISRLMFRINKQNYSCEICGHPFEDRYDFVIEHCHTNNKIRGICCRRCNNILGMTKENITYLNLLIKYINKYKKKFAKQNKSNWFWANLRSRKVASLY
jgi:hypothetical protein